MKFIHVNSPLKILRVRPPMKFKNFLNIKKTINFYIKKAVPSKKILQTGNVAS